MAASLGKIPTTSLRRVISSLTRSSRLVELVQCSGEGVEGDQVLFGVLEQPADLRGDWLEAGDHVGTALATLVAVLGGEYISAALVAAAVVERVSGDAGPSPRQRAHPGGGHRPTAPLRLWTP